MEALFLKMLNMSLIAGILVLAILIVRPVFKKTPGWMACALWGLVAIRLVVPFSFQSSLSLVPEIEPVQIEAAKEFVPDSNTENGKTDDSQREVEQLIPTSKSSDNPSVDLSSQNSKVLSSNYVSPVRVLSVVWLFGIGAILIYSLINDIKIHRKISIRMLIGERTYLCDEIDAPFVYGVFRPVIMLPSSIGEDELGYVLAHERAHIRSGDHIWKVISFLLLTVYWYNPLIWLAYILFCQDIETACDQKAVADENIEYRKQYAKVLLLYSAERAAFVASPVAFGAKNVKRRVRSVLRYKKPALWIALVGVAMCIVLGVFLLTDPVADVGKVTIETDPGDAYAWIALRHGQKVYYGGYSEQDSKRETVYGLNMINLSTKEKRFLTDDFETCPVFYKGDVYYVSKDQMLMSCNETTGEKHAVVNDKIVYEELRLQGDLLYYKSYDEDDEICLNAYSLKDASDRRLSDGIAKDTTILTYEDSICVTLKGNKTHLIFKNGEQIGSFETKPEEGVWFITDKGDQVLYNEAKSTLAIRSVDGSEDVVLKEHIMPPLSLISSGGKLLITLKAPEDNGPTHMELFCIDLNNRRIDSLGMVAYAPNLVLDRETLLCVPGVSDMGVPHMIDLSDNTCRPLVVAAED